VSQSPALNPYAPPSAEVVPVNARDTRYLAHREADGVIAIQKDVVLPAVCVKCGAREGLRTRKQQFIYTPSWVYLLLLLNIIILAIVASIVQKKGKLTFSVCQPCHSKWRNASIAWFFSALLIVFGGVATIVFAVAEQPIAAVLMLATTIALPTYVHTKMRVPNTLRSKLVDKQLIRLVGMHDAAQEAVLTEARQ
jgi:hypothetical protein